MAYHEAFWVTTGTAAPVIALASIVSTADALGARDFFTRVLPGIRPKTADQQDWLDRMVTRVLRLNSWVYLAATVNGFLQMAALTFALTVLALGRDWVSPVVAEVTVPLGVLLLLVTSTLTVRVRMTQREISQELAPGSGDTA